MKKYVIAFLMFISACSHKQKIEERSNSKREVIDSSAYDGEVPSWVKKNQVSWESEDRIVVRGFSSVLGHERLNGCFELAKLQAKKGLLTDIQEDIKGYLDTGSVGLSEQDEVIFSEAVGSSYAGKIQGMKVSENYFERFVVNGSERIDCYALSEIRKSDYERLKRAIIFKVADMSPDIKKALIEKQIRFHSAPQADNPSVGNTVAQDVVPKRLPQKLVESIPQAAVQESE